MSGYNKTNSVSITLFWIGIAIIVICFIIGMVFGSKFSISSIDHNRTFFIRALPWWGFGFVSGMVFIGFAEALKLLQDNANKLEEIAKSLTTMDNEKN